MGGNPKGDEGCLGQSGFVEGPGWLSLLAAPTQRVLILPFGMLLAGWRSQAIRWGRCLIAQQILAVPQ